ncbi:hypothetical protein B566_EDAN002128, partial [Ephemera danica]
MDEDVRMLYRNVTPLQGTLLYQAIKAFSPAGSGELALEQDDVLEVSEASSSSAPTGWLLGSNQRTGAQGYFPCAYTKRLDPRVFPSTSTSENYYSKDDYARMAKFGESTPSSSMDKGRVSNSPSVVASPGNGSGTLTSSVQHRIRPVYFLTPVLCRH